MKEVIDQKTDRYSTTVASRVPDPRGTTVLSSEEEDESERVFWSGPLGAWIRDCISGPSPMINGWRFIPMEKKITYDELRDGTALSYLYFNHIDQLGDIYTSLRDTPSGRLLYILESIGRFYKIRLNRLIVMALPNVLTILNNPNPDGPSGHEMNKLLLLLIGCAVQGESRSSFVTRITKMEDTLQKALVEQIQRVTDSTEVVAVAALSVEGDMRDRMDRLMEGSRDNDDYAHEHTESDESSSTTDTPSLNGDALPSRVTDDRYVSTNRSPSPSIDRHLNVEIAAVRAAMRKLQRVIGVKEDEIYILREESETKSKEIRDLQSRNISLCRDASEVRILRDEIDALRQKIEKLEKCEKENKILKEKLEDLDLFKGQVEDLKQENRDLENKIRDLNSSLERNRARAVSAMENETRMAEIEKIKRELHNEITKKNSEIERLISDLSRTTAQLNEQSAKASELERIANDSSFYARESLGNSLLDEMNDSTRSEMADLRSENSILKTRLESSLSESVSVEWKERAERYERELEEQKEERRLVEQQLYELEITLSDISQQYKKMKVDYDEVRTEKDESIRSLMEARKNFTEFQSEFGKKMDEENKAKINDLERNYEELQREMEEIKDEKNEVQRQIEKMKREEYEMKEKIDRLEEEKTSALSTAESSQRTKKTSEGEKNALRDKLSMVEDELEELRVRLIENGDWKKRAELAEKSLGEKISLIGDIQGENRQMKHQMEMELSKTQRLREDLIIEKTKNAEMIGRIRGVCNTIAFNGAKIDKDMDDIKMIESIDNVIMETLNTAKREADALRLQGHMQIAELTDLKRDIENLRRSENKSLVEVDDQVKRLNEENTSIKEQVFLLQEKNREQQIELSSRLSELNSYRREIEQLNHNSVQSQQTNSELAKLQVSLRNLQLQEEILKKDNRELRNQLEAAEKGRLKLEKSEESLHAMHKALLSDHDRLQNLHDLLSSDYERAKEELIDMRHKIRNVKLPISYAEYESMRSSLESERISRETKERSLHDLRLDFETLRKEKECLVRNCDQLSQELRRVRVAEQNNKCSSSELRVQMERMAHDLHKKDLVISELRKEIELLQQMNRQLKEDSRELFRQNESLLKENHNLHSRLLNDKDSRLEEQKDFQERLNTLHRNQERLEGKIMDHYKTLENVNRSTKKQPTFMKRTVKALIPKKSRSVEKTSGSTGSTTEESSAYSADEAPLYSNGYGMDEAILQPTSSSSEEADRHSPRYDTIDQRIKGESIPPSSMNGIRPRNGLIGGSVRISSNRSPTKRNPLYNDSDIYVSLNDSSLIYSTPSASSSLPPRAPIRGSSVSSSMRSIRPPPPPYGQRSRPPPPSYNSRTSTPLQNGSSLNEFNPQYASTPKSDRSISPVGRNVVKEGEKREFIRDKEERIDKAMSIYENVDANSHVPNKPNESTVWYEYGCV